MNERDLKPLDKFLFRELRNFCMQYEDKLKEIDTIRGLSCSGMDGMPRGSDTSNPTEIKAERAMERLKLIEYETKVIEQSAIQASDTLYQWIIRHVTLGIPYDYLRIPCGYAQFVKARRKFYIFLALNLKKIDTL